MRGLGFYKTNLIIYKIYIYDFLFFWSEQNSAIVIAQNCQVIDGLLLHLNKFGYLFLHCPCFFRALHFADIIVVVWQSSCEFLHFCRGVFRDIAIFKEHLLPLVWIDGNPACASHFWQAWRHAVSLFHFDFSEPFQLTQFVVPYCGEFKECVGGLKLDSPETVDGVLAEPWPPIALYLFHHWEPPLALCCGCWEGEDEVNNIKEIRKVTAPPSVDISPCEGFELVCLVSIIAYNKVNSLPDGKWLCRSF